MKTLTLIRHAKASQDYFKTDKERPIIAIGKLNSQLVYANYKLQIAEKQTVWCSTATRTVQTAELFSKSLDAIEYKDNLYTFDGNELEKIIKSCDNSIQNLLIFGHNDAITHIVNKFGSVFIDSVPTSGLVSINFNYDNWKDISNGTTKMTIFPKDLKKQFNF